MKKQGLSDAFSWMKQRTLFSTGDNRWASSPQERVEEEGEPPSSLILNVRGDDDDMSEMNPQLPDAGGRRHFSISS